MRVRRKRSSAKLVSTKVLLFVAAAVVGVFGTGVLVGVRFFHSRNDHNVPHHMLKSSFDSPPPPQARASRGAATPTTLGFATGATGKQNRNDDDDRHPLPAVDGLVINARAPKIMISDNLDPASSAELSFEAEIFLTGSDVNRQMKTIVSNRDSGCSTGPDTAGYAFFVNTWNTDDRKLVLMWSDRRNGCVSVSTPEHSIPYGVWTKVGFTLKSRSGNSDSAVIRVDGKPIEFLNPTAAGKPSKTPRARAHASRKTFVGIHADHMYPFVGKIKHVSWKSGSEILGSFPLVSSEEKLSLYADTQGIQRALDVSSKNLDNFLSNSRTNQRPAKFSASASSSSSHMVDSQSDTSRLPNGEIRHYDRGFEWLVNVPETELIEGSFSDDVDEETLAESDRLGDERKELVRNAMKFAYNNYEKKAMGFDEVRPRTGVGKNNWAGMGVTLVDSLDTLWLMDLKEEFWRGRDWVRDHLEFDSIRKTVSLFETNIREMGGLVAAYGFSKDEAFLKKAISLGDKLMPAFDTPTGIPRGSVALNAGALKRKSSGGGSAVLAEVGSLQIEWRALSVYSNDPKYANAVEKVHQVIRKHNDPEDGLYPIYISTKTGKFSNRQITFGALGDSFYEYLLKIWIQGGYKEVVFRREYDAAMDGVFKKLVQTSTPSGLKYMADIVNGRLKHKMDHLACFVPGMLALGVHTNPGGPNASRDLKLAKAMMYTCYQMYDRQVTGISPEFVNFVQGKDLQVPASTAFYILRPEMVESLFVLHQVTKHPIYRDWGHQVMLSIEKYCRVNFGYGALPDVRSTARKPDDRQESFFFAETLKYLYLLQNPNHPIDLKKFVFNTEAHPIPVFEEGWREKLGLSSSSSSSVD